jgi:carboxyl-terminal processing protease
MTIKIIENMFKKLIFTLFVISIVSCGSKPRVNLTEVEGGLKPSAQHEVIAKEVAGLLESTSYKKVQLNDSISKIVFDNLIKTLDQGKNYLLQSDIDEFQQYRNTIAQDFRNGDLSAPFHIFNVYSKRYLERMQYALKQVDVKQDFTLDEYFLPSREKLGWFKNTAEADTQWKHRVKYDLLNLEMTTVKKTDSTETKQKETLRKRYNNLISQGKKTNSNDAFQLIMTALTDAVDPHTSYFNPSFAQAFNEGMANTFEGIGARLTIDNEMVTISEIIPGGPIFKDKSLAIDDKIVGVAQGKDGEFEDIIGWRLDAAVAKIKGPAGTLVRLKIIPAGQPIGAHPKIVSLTRERIVVAEESAKKEILNVKGADGKTYRVGVINIPKFYMDFEAYRKRDPNYKSTTRDVRLLLDTLKQEKVDAVLIDLRFNGGGSLPEAIDLTGLFIDKGPVVQVRDVRNSIDVEEDRNAGVSWDGPLGVMINRFSASASEIFAGAIQDYGRGVILGSQSYGKGTVQSAVDMSRVISPTSKLLLKAQQEKDPDTPNGAPEYGQINITLGKFYRVNGSSTQHKGVSPDVTFPTQYSAEKFGESSEPSALPWDQIKSSTYKKVADLTPINKKLEQEHEARMKNSTEYKFLLEDIASFEKRDEETKIPLQLDKFKKERDDNQKKNRDRVNALLKQRGLPLWEEGKPQPKMEFDFVQDESAKVMTDFIIQEKK